MKVSDHYIGEQTDIFVINMADDTTDTVTASMGSSTDTASEVEWISSVMKCIVYVL